MKTILSSPIQTKRTASAFAKTSADRFLPLNPDRRNLHLRQGYGGQVLTPTLSSTKPWRRGRETGWTSSRGSRSSSGFTLVELLTVLAIIAVLAGLLLPALSSAKRSAQSISCVSNLRQIGLSAMMYADDHEGRLPSIEPVPTSPIDTNAPLPRLAEALSSYLGGSNNVVRCPEDRVGRWKIEGGSYEWNAMFNNRKLDSIGSGKVAVPLEKSPMVYDYENFHIGSTTTDTNIVVGKKNVYFADGHVAPL